MDDSIKRAVSKRQAAMDSEKKWQEAFDADIMYELSMPLKKFKTESLLNEALNLPKPLPQEQSFEGKEEYTVMNNCLLYEMVACLVCPNCMAKEIQLDIGRGMNGFTQNIRVSCKKCNHEPFSRGFEPIHYHFKSPQHVSVEKVSFPTQLGDHIHKNAEVLVCDVDVPDNPFSPCSINGHFSNQDSYVSDFCDDTPVRTVVTPSKNDTASKPLRPCVFCSKMQARLRQHVKTAHWSHPFVMDMVRQPPRQQAKLMRQLRSEGILAENKRRLKSGRSDLLRVRNQGSGELTVCAICGGYYKKNVLWRHKATCTGRPQLIVCPNDVAEPPDDSFVAPGGPRLIKGELDLSGWPSPPASSVVVNGGSIAASRGDVSEIDKIKEILDGINHGVFVPAAATAVCHSDAGYPVKMEPPSTPNGIFSAGGLDRAIFSPPPMPEDLMGDFAAAAAADGGDRKRCDDTVARDDFDAQSSEIAGFIASLVATKPEGDDQHAAEINEDQLLFDSLPAIISGRDSAVRASWSDSTEDDGQFDWGDVKYDVFPDAETMAGYAMYQSKRRKRSRSDFQYQFWKKEHEDRIREYFSSMVDALKVPGKEACQEFLKNNTDITTDWVRVKYKVYNEIQKRKKRIKRTSSPVPTINMEQPSM